MTPKVSICIPVYKAEAYIEQCARSLFEQTMREGLEFIFVNDCTPDKSFDVLEAVLKEYPHRKKQVRIISLEQNGGVANARKMAMQAATGEYVIHCDPDDWVDKAIYEKLYSKAKETDADMVYCDYIRYFSSQEQHYMYAGEETDKEKIINLLIRRKFRSELWAKLYKREVINQIDLQLLPNHIFFGEDLVLNLQLMLECKRIVKLNEPLYYYRVVQNSITDGWAKNIRVKRNIFQLQLAFDQIITDAKFSSSMEWSQRFALYTAISSGVTTAREWHRLWKSAKRGMWRDKRWNIAQKLIFYAACINFTFTSFVFKLSTGRLKASKQ